MSELDRYYDHEGHPRPQTSDLRDAIERIIEKRYEYIVGDAGDITDGEQIKADLRAALARSENSP